MKECLELTIDGEAYVALSRAAYEKLVEAAEDAADLRAIAQFERRLAAGEEELLPSDMVDRILAGENRVRVWREHRGFSVSALAEKAITGNEKLPATMTLEIAGVKLNVTFEGTIALE